MTTETVDDLVKQLSDPDVEFTLTPHNTLKTAEFLYKTKRINKKPAEWKELYFSNVHNRPGARRRYIGDSPEGELCGKVGGQLHG